MLLVLWEEEDEENGAKDDLDENGAKVGGDDSSKEDARWFDQVMVALQGQGTDLTVRFCYNVTANDRDRYGPAFSEDQAAILTRIGNNFEAFMRDNCLRDTGQSTAIGENNSSRNGEEDETMD